MAGCSGRKLTFRTAAVLFGVASGVVLISTGPVHAQGLFDVLNRIFGGFLGQGEEKAAPSGPTAAYCVRLCDGRYFPLPVSAGMPQSSADKTCSAMCPATATKVYTGSGIDQASAADGTPYSKLENAFAYRERMVSDCTCTGKEGAGIVTMDIHSDPTLRPGDIVVTKAGPKVFNGSNQLPYQTSDFIPAEDFKGLPAGVRRTLAELKVAPQPESAPGNVAASSTPAAEPQRAPSPQDTPVAEAFPIFPFALQ